MKKNAFENLVNNTATAPTLLDDDFLWVNGNGSCGLTTCGNTCKKTCDVTCNQTTLTTTDPK